MSEVIISRRGGSSGSGELITEYITFNRNWTMPSGIKDNSLAVRIFGAGGSNNLANNARGTSASGWMNNTTLSISPGSVIKITIGKPTLSTGGTTSFGTYLSANGGTRTGGGAGGSGFAFSTGTVSAHAVASNGYQFGGGGSIIALITASSYSGNGGNGGTWGGGGGGGYCGGKGGTYGGGGGAGSHINGTPSSFVSVVGGNGGTYGGGGGAGSRITANNDYATAFAVLNNTNLSGGWGGSYGGRGGNGAVYTYNHMRPYSNNVYTRATNGTNTSTWTNVTKDDVTGDYFRGNGTCGLGADRSNGQYDGCAGGGGFGGCGGNGGTTGTGGGGGGYGGNGGAGANLLLDGESYYIKSCGGGGGGYGSAGQSAYTQQGGGGGGYGKGAFGYNGGGGGYYCPGGGINRSSSWCGGGGIGIWENNVLVASFGSGQSFCSNVQQLQNLAAEPGICIIQYYK